MEFQLHLYWRDKNWVKRGYALNLNVAVDFRRKIFMTFENPRYDYVNSNSLEVVRKQDIRDYIHFLKREGFEEEYEKYRDFQLKRIYAVMDRFIEKTEKIKSEI